MQYENTATFYDDAQGLALMDRYQAFLELQAKSDALSAEEYLEQLDAILGEGAAYGYAEGDQAGVPDPGEIEVMLALQDDEEEYRNRPRRVMAFDTGQGGSGGYWDGTQWQSGSAPGTEAQDGRGEPGEGGPETGEAAEEEGREEEAAGEEFQDAEDAYEEETAADDIREGTDPTLDIRYEGGQESVPGENGEEGASLAASATGSAEAEDEAEAGAPGISSEDEADQAARSELEAFYAESWEEDAPEEQQEIDAADAGISASEEAPAQGRQPEAAPPQGDSFRVTEHAVIHDWLDELAAGTGLLHGIETIERIPAQETPGQGAQAPAFEKTAAMKQMDLMVAQKFPEPDFEPKGPSGPSR